MAASRTPRLRHLSDVTKTIANTQTKSITTSSTSRAAVATASQQNSRPQSSNLPHTLQNAIRRDASLRTPDPPPDSQTDRMTSSQLPFMVPTYVRPPPVFAKGDGCYLYDVENRQYLDFTAGIAVTALGHADPEITRILSSQAATLIHSSNLYHNPWTGLLSQKLVERTIASGAMKDAARAFICNSGSEANEAAIKFARKVGHSKDPSGNKHKVVSFRNGFHGRTFGALSATPNPKYQAPFGPMVPGFVTGEYNDVEALDSLVDDHTCGVIVEPIQGEGGVRAATPDFLKALRKRCDETGAVLIYDEIQCGMGRTGTFWAHNNILGPGGRGSHPDILTTAKAIGNGYPVGATIVTEEISGHIITGDHGTTFGGNPLGARIAHHIVGRLSDPQFLEEVGRKGQIFRKHIEKLAARFPDVIQEVRGQGLMLGIQVTHDVAKVITAARERGLLVISCGVETLRLVPPLIVEDGQIEEGIKILGEAMQLVYGACPGTIEQAAGERDTKGQQEMADNPAGSR